MRDPLGDFSYTWPFLTAAIVGYFVGSIPFGLVLTKLAGLGDVRKIGSGNIGATNVLRTGNKGLALATLLLDGGKAHWSSFSLIHFLRKTTQSWQAEALSWDISFRYGSNLKGVRASPHLLG